MRNLFWLSNDAFAGWSKSEVTFFKGRHGPVLSDPIKSLFPFEIVQKRDGSIRCTALLCE